MLLSYYLKFGFTSILTKGIDKPQSVICLKVLSAESMKPFQLKRHFEKEHPAYKDRDIYFFQRKSDSAKKSRLDNTGQTYINTRAAVESDMLCHCELQNLRNPILLVKN